MKSQHRLKKFDLRQPDVMAEDEQKKLDIFSAEFDASEAIFNPEFVLPVPEAPASNNVDTFVARYEGKRK